MVSGYWLSSCWGYWYRKVKWIADSSYLLLWLGVISSIMEKEPRERFSETRRGLIKCSGRASLGSRTSTAYNFSRILSNLFSSWSSDSFSFSYLTKLVSNDYVPLPIKLFLLLLHNDFYTFWDIVLSIYFTFIGEFYDDLIFLHIWPTFFSNILIILSLRDIFYLALPDKGLTDITFLFGVFISISCSILFFYLLTSYVIFNVLSSFSFINYYSSSRIFCFF